MGGSCEKRTTQLLSILWSGSGPGLSGAFPRGPGAARGSAGLGRTPPGDAGNFHEFMAPVLGKGKGCP